MGLGSFIWYGGGTLLIKVVIDIRFVESGVIFDVSNGVDVQSISMPLVSGIVFEIVATGPGKNDWIISGGNTADPFGISFYGSSGLIANNTNSVEPFLTYGGRPGPHFVSGTFVSGDPFNPLYTYAWHTPSGFGTGTTQLSSAGGGFTISPFEFVLPGVADGGRLTRFSDPAGYERLSSFCRVAGNYSHALFVGNRPASGSGFTSGNSWVVDAAGNFARTPTNYNIILTTNRFLGITWPFAYYFPSAFPSVFTIGSPGQVKVPVIKSNIETGESETITGIIYNPGDRFVSTAFAAAGIY
jgi:hypothetical protein